MSRQNWIVVAAAAVIVIVVIVLFMPANETVPPEAPPPAAERELGPAGVTGNEPGPDVPGLPAADPQATPN